MQAFREIAGVASVAHGVPNTGDLSKPRRATGERAHVVPCPQKRVSDVRSDEAGSTYHEDPHRTCSSGLVEEDSSTLVHGRLVAAALPAVFRSSESYNLAKAAP